MPRCKSDIWERFERIQKGACFKAKCKDCGITMQGIVERMKNHIAKTCSGSNPSNEDIVIPNDVSTAAVSSEAATTSSEPTTSSDPNKENSSTSTSAPKRQRTDGLITKSVTKTTKSTKNDIDEAVAKMIYATNCPFRIVEHECFIKLVEKLRPGYKLPTRKEIGGPLLDKVHQNLQTNCKEKLTGSTVCMAMDGWSNVHNEPVVCVSVTTESGDTYVTETIDTSGVPHTSSNLKDMAQSAIKKAENQYGCRVGSFVTDNAANMTAMRRALKSEDDDVITLGCGAHILNLLAKDLEIANVHKHIVKIAKYFRNKHLPAAW